jgi:hypothetical protein
MAYRVYDNERKKWLKDNIYMSPDECLFKIKQGLLGMTKIPLDAERYIYHKDIGLYDKNSKLVFEGDYILARVAEDKEVVGFVAYAYELSAWVILCDESNEFFTLGSSVSAEISIIGNVFDGYEK